MDLMWDSTSPPPSPLPHHIRFPILFKLCLLHGLFALFWALWGHILGDVDKIVSKMVLWVWNTHPLTLLGGGQTSDSEKFYKQTNRKPNKTWKRRVRRGVELLSIESSGKISPRRGHRRWDLSAQKPLAVQGWRKEHYMCRTAGAEVWRWAQAWCMLGKERRPVCERGREWLRQ